MKQELRKQKMIINTVFKFSKMKVSQKAVSQKRDPQARNTREKTVNI